MLWLETSAPGPPDRHSYRFERDWEYLARSFADEAVHPGRRLGFRHGSAHLSRVPELPGHSRIGERLREARQSRA